MFSKRLSLTDTRPTLPAAAAAFRVNTNFVDMLERFTEARVSNTARRSEGIIADTDTLMKRLESADPVRSGDLPGFVSIGLGRAVTALQDELNAQRVFLLRMGEEDSGSVRLLRQRFAETLARRIGVVRELGERLHTQIERFGERLSNLMKPGRADEPLSGREPHSGGVPDSEIASPGRGSVQMPDAASAASPGQLEAVRASTLRRLQLGEQRERDDDRRHAAGDGESGLRIARDRRDRLMRLLATIEEEAVVMRPGDRDAAIRTLSRLAQPGELNLSAGDMARVEDAEEQVRERF